MIWTRLRQIIRLAALAGVLLPSIGWAKGVVVEQCWMRYLLPGLPAAGYMVLKNNTDAEASLTAAASPACAMLMLHLSADASGTATMTGLQSISIPAHGSVSLAPGGYHLMCMQPRMRVGGRVNMTLRFQDGATLSVAAPVYGAQGGP